MIEITEQSLQDLLALDLEYKLTVAVRANPYDSCPCAGYLIRRRETLIPEILKKARENGTDPLEDFARFAAILHDEHPEGM